MRHLVHAVKIMVTEDFREQERRGARRIERSAAAPAAKKAAQPAARPAVAAQPATRTSDVPRPRHAANAGA